MYHHSPNLVLGFHGCTKDTFEQVLYHHQELEPSDSIRGAFIEGKRIYPNSGFYEKTHIQICVRNPNCIKGYFAPKREHADYKLI